MNFMVAALQLSAASLPAPTMPSVPCSSDTRHSFASTSELPVGVLDAFGSAIADSGQPYQAGDVRLDPPLPIYRFVNAEQRGCTISIVYQYGGRGNGTAAVSLIAEGSRWKLVGNLIYHKRSRSGPLSPPNAAK